MRRSGISLTIYAATYRRSHCLTELCFGFLVSLVVNTLLSLCQSAGADVELHFSLVYVVGAAYAVHAAFDNSILDY